MSQDIYYEGWEQLKDRADYRSRETQASALTRSLLKKPEYLLRSNRVNPGPGRNIRAAEADSKPQTPHNLNNEDCWGWESWRDPNYDRIDTDISDSLFEKRSAQW